MLTLSGPDGTMQVPFCCYSTAVWVFTLTKTLSAFLFFFLGDGFEVGTINKLGNLTDPIINNVSCISIGFFLSFEIYYFEFYAMQIIFYKKLKLNKRFYC